jgi:hypothetical protein
MVSNRVRVIPRARFRVSVRIRIILRVLVRKKVKFKVMACGLGIEVAQSLDSVLGLGRCPGNRKGWDGFKSRTRVEIGLG